MNRLVQFCFMKAKAGWTQGGALMDFSHGALTLMSLLSALSCLVGQCQHRKSMARVFILSLLQAELAVRDSGWKSTVEQLEFI